MPSARIRCENCNRWFRARRDAVYCSERCRYRIRSQDAKIDAPTIPTSGVPGVTFSRIRQRWEVRVREDQRWKYVGAFKDMQDAIRLQKEVKGDEAVV